MDQIGREILIHDKHINLHNSLLDPECIITSQDIVFNLNSVIIQSQLVLMTEDCISIALRFLSRYLNLTGTELTKVDNDLQPNIQMYNGSRITGTIHAFAESVLIGNVVEFLATLAFTLKELFRAHLLHVCFILS
jgi:hypothetical protein